MAETYLVTGAAGFIGPVVSKQLQEQGKHVIGLDDFSLGRAENLRDDIEFVEANFCNMDSIEKLAGKKIDGIFHLSGQSGGELSFSEPLFDIDANARSMHVAIELSKLNNFCPIVHASSVAVYGDTVDNEVLTENKRPKPKSPYGVSKLAGEGYLEVFEAHYGIPSVSLRLFNVYGAGQDLARLNQGMLSIYLSQALASREVKVKGAITRYRDFVHVVDAANAFVVAMDYLKTSGGNHKFNVCTGQKTTVGEALDVLQQEFSGDLTITEAPPTPGDSHGWLGSYDRIYQELNWMPTVAFDAGFREMIRAEVRRSRG